MKSFLIFVVCVILAVASFGFARYQYVQRHSATVTNPFKSSQKAQMTDPFIDQNLIGNWVKDEWVFAIAIPIVLIVGGLVVSARR